MPLDLATKIHKLPLSRVVCIGLKTSCGDDPRMELAGR